MKNKIRNSILIDTDIGPDCDDIGALALLNSLANEGYVNIAGVTVCTSSIYGAGCVDVVNRFYHNKNIPVGTYEKEGFLCGEEYEKYNRYIVENYDNGFRNEKAPSAVELSREILYKQADNSVIYIAIGPLNNLYNLLYSEATDQIPLSGMDLIKSKVKRLVTMSCCFVKGDRYPEVEWNVEMDIKSAKGIFANWPTPIWVAPFELGVNVITGKFDNDANCLNPIKKAYELHSPMGRSSWDLIAIWTGIFGNDKLFKLSEKGTINIDDRGRSKFISDNGEHYIININTQKKLVEETFNKHLNKPRGKINES